MKHRTLIFATTIATAALLAPASGRAQSWGTASYASTQPRCCAELPGVTDSTPVREQASSLSKVNYLSPGIGISHDIAGRASAHSDLRTGKLGASASSSYYAESAAGAAIRERFQFAIAGAQESDRTEIRVRYSFHGTFEANPVGSHATSFFNANMFHYTNSPFGLAYHGTPSASVYRETSVHFPDFEQRSSSGWKSISFTRVGNTHFMDGTIDLVGAMPIIDLNMTLALTTFQDAQANFSNTATIELFLPKKVSWTTSSGIFEAVNAVPEPSTWALMIGGFGAVGAAARRRQVISAA